MRTILLIALLIGLIWTATNLPAQILTSRDVEAKDEAAQHASPDWQASVAVAKRVGAGDKQSLSELVGLDPVVAVPLLAHYAKDRSTDAERAAIALAALKKVRGIREYFRPLITALHAQIGGDFDTERQFDTLAWIGTREAAAAAAPFLFDDSESNNPEPHGDYSVSAIRYQAVDALMKMKLPDAPTNKPFYAANDEDIKLWRTWWLAHKAEYEN